MDDISVRDICRSKILAFILVMPAYFDVINVVLRTMGVEAVSTITALIYIGVLIYIIIKCGIRTDDLLILLLVYLGVAIHYLLFSDSREYLNTQGMMIVLLFFIPYGVLAIRKTKDWDTVFHYMYRFSAIAIITGAIMLLFFPYDKYLVYMDYSFALLPAICSCYYQYTKGGSFNASKYRQRFAGFLFGIGIIEIIAFGARACVLYAIMFVVIVEMLRDDTSIRRKVIVTIASIGVTLFLLFWLDEILTYFSSLSIFGNSYLIRSYLRGNLFTSDTRTLIWESCIKRIQTMGLSVSGFFGDRKYCIAVYPHNIVLEILMSWGWIIGICILTYIIALFFVGIRSKGKSRIGTILLLCSVFSRYILSGSYVIEGKFWILLFALIAIAHMERLKNRQLS